MAFYQLFEHIESAIFGFYSALLSALSVEGSVLYFQSSIYELCNMDLYSAIHEMRRLSKENKPFSFTFMSCNLTKGTSDGIINVRRARLLKRPDAKYHENAEFVERYLDLDTMKSRFFYQPLLMTFNSQTVKLQ